MPILFAAAVDALQQVGTEPGWVPLGVAGVLLTAAIRFAFNQRREGAQDSGWQKLLNSAHQATSDAQAEAAKLRKENGELRGELDNVRRTLADTSEQLRETLIRNADLEAQLNRR